MPSGGAQPGIPPTQVFNAVNLGQIFMVAAVASAIWWQSESVADVAGAMFFVSIQQSFNGLNVRASLAENLTLLLSSLALVVQGSRGNFGETRMEIIGRMLQRRRTASRRRAEIAIMGLPVSPGRRIRTYACLHHLRVVSLAATWLCLPGGSSRNSGRFL